MLTDNFNTEKKSYEPLKPVAFYALKASRIFEGVFFNKDVTARVCGFFEGTDLIGVTDDINDVEYYSADVLMLIIRYSEMIIYDLQTVGANVENRFGTNILGFRFNVEKNYPYEVSVVSAEERKRYDTQLAKAKLFGENMREYVKKSMVW